jgi:DNA primase
MYSKQTIDTLKALADPVQVLVSIGGVPYSEICNRETEVRCPCPLHGGDTKEGFSWSKKYDGWQCFTKSCGGNEAHDVYGFIKLKLNCSFNQAVERLAELCNFNLEKDDQVSNLEDYQKLISIIKSNAEQDRARVAELAGLQEFPNFYNHPVGFEYVEKYIQLRNYPGLQSISKYNLYPFLDSYKQLRVGIPSYSKEGTLVGVNARRLDGILQYGDCPKYWITPGYKKENALFNLNNVDLKNGKRSLIIVEGEFSCIRLNFYGWTNSVACLGNTLSQKQITLAASCSLDLFFLIERGAAARQGFIKTLEKLDKSGIITVSYAELPDKDPDEAPFLELESLLDNPTLINIKEFLNNPYTKFKYD